MLAGPFRSAAHAATSIQPGVLSCWQMNPGPASVPVTPEVKQNSLGRAWKAQCAQHYGNNHRGASYLSLVDNLTKECHHRFTDGKTELREEGSLPKGTDSQALTRKAEATGLAEVCIGPTR